MPRDSTRNLRSVFGLFSQCFRRDPRGGTSTEGKNGSHPEGGAYADAHDAYSDLGCRHGVSSMKRRRVSAIMLTTIRGAAFSSRSSTARGSTRKTNSRYLAGSSRASWSRRASPPTRPQLVATASRISRKSVVVPLGVPFRRPGPGGRPFLRICPPQTVLRNRWNRSYPIIEPSLGVVESDRPATAVRR